MSGRTSSIAANMRWRLMDESKYTDGFIWSVGPVFNSSEKRLARTLLLLANFGKERRPEPITTKISQETLANGTIIGRNGVVCCLRMTALRPVIVVRSSVQKPATSARGDSARLDRLATVGIVLAPCRTPAAGSTAGHGATS